jgi:DNA replication protein DnaC
MLAQQTIEKLHGMQLGAMADAFQEQLDNPAMDELTFAERFGLLVDRLWIWREDKRMKRLLNNAKLKLQACPEDIDYRAPRGIDKSVLLALINCGWIRKHQNVLITGPTGVGKTYIACALAQKACREGITVTYVRAPRLYHDLAIARADGSYSRLMGRLGRTRLVLIDDFGLAPMSDPDRRNFLEVVEDRHLTGSTIVTSQLPLEHWHEAIGDATLADAILDRLVHNAHKIALKGDSMRKRRSGLTETQDYEKP